METIVASIPHIEDKKNNKKLYYISGTIIFTIAIIGQIYIILFNNISSIDIGYLQRQQYSLYAQIELLMVTVGVTGLLLRSTKQIKISLYILFTLAVGYTFLFSYADNTFWDPFNNIIVLFVLFFISQTVNSILEFKNKNTNIFKIIGKNIFWNIVFFIVLYSLFYVLGVLDCISYGCIHT